MVINFNPKYIPGDIVYNHKKEIIRITSSYLKGTKLFYYRDGEYGWIREDAIAPIPSHSRDSREEWVGERSDV